MQKIQALDGPFGAGIMWKYTVWDEVLPVENTAEYHKVTGIQPYVSIQIISYSYQEEGSPWNIILGLTVYRDGWTPLYVDLSSRSDEELLLIEEKYLRAPGTGEREDTQPNLLRAKEILLRNGREEMEQLLRVFPAHPLPGWRSTSTSRRKGISDDLFLSIDIGRDDKGCVYYDASARGRGNILCRVEIDPTFDRKIRECDDPLAFVEKALKKEMKRLGKSLCSIRE